MKNIIFILLGFYITMYTMAIGNGILSAGIRKNELENCVSRIVTQALEYGYGQSSQEMVKQRIISDLRDSFGMERNLEVTILANDMEKGVLSVRVTENYRQVNGKERQISCEKTAIVEKKYLEQESVTVRFYVEEELYKEFILTKGEDCPIPKLPGSAFVGWEEYGGREHGPVSEIKDVKEDRIYVAITE